LLTEYLRKLDEVKSLTREYTEMVTAGLNGELLAPIKSKVAHARTEMPRSAAAVCGSLSGTWVLVLLAEIPYNRVGTDPGLNPRDAETTVPQAALSLVRRLREPPRELAAVCGAMTVDREIDASNCSSVITPAHRFSASIAVPTRELNRVFPDDSVAYVLLNLGCILSRLNRRDRLATLFAK
jgi:hypothetical protein